MRNVSARPLTPVEIDNFTTTYSVGRTPSGLLPPYGRVFDVPVNGVLSHVLVFDAANGQRYFTLVSGADSDALAAQINLPNYQSPDAGLLAFLEDLARRGQSLGVSLMNVAVLGLAVYLLARYSR